MEMISSGCTAFFDNRAIGVLNTCVDATSSALWRWRRNLCSVVLAARCRRVPLHRRDRIPRRSPEWVARIIGRRAALRSSLMARASPRTPAPQSVLVETIFIDIVRIAEPENLLNRLIDIAADA